MPLVDHTHRQITFKVVFYGAGLGGKTANLEYIFDHTRPEQRGRLISVRSSQKRTLFLDFLPLDLGTWRDYKVSVHLCAAPGQVAQDTTRQLVLRGSDAVVLVIDSAAERMDANAFAIRNLAFNLRLHGANLNTLPLVVQYNKRDLEDALGIDEIRSTLGIPLDAEEISAVATQGQGVAETLKAITKQCLRLAGEPESWPEGRFEYALNPPRWSFRPPGPLSMIRELRHVPGETALKSRAG